MPETEKSAASDYTFNPESLRSAAEQIAKTFPAVNSRNVISDYAAKHLDGIPKSTFGIPDSIVTGRPARWSDYGAYESSKLPVYVPPPPNPGYETNGQLYRMNARIEALIQVAERQAELIQVMTESAKATLEMASQSSVEARASTDLARTSTELARSSLRFTRVALWIAVVSVVINIGVSIYLNHSNNTADLRSQEVQVLRGLSERLAKAPASTAPQQNTKPLQPNR